MHVFYTPDIQKSNELPEEEAQHCIRVLRLSIGDEITLTDGKGNFYKAEITVATNKRCFVNIKETIFQEPLWPCHLHIAMAPTKNMAIRNLAALTAPLFIFEKDSGIDTPAVAERAGGRKPFQSLS